MLAIVGAFASWFGHPGQAIHGKLRVFSTVGDLWDRHDTPLDTEVVCALIRIEFCSKLIRTGRNGPAPSLDAYAVASDALVRGFREITFVFTGPQSEHSKFSNARSGFEGCNSKTARNFGWRHFGHVSLMFTVKGIAFTSLKNSVLP